MAHKNQQTQHYLQIELNIKDAGVFLDEKANLFRITIPAALPSLEMQQQVEDLAASYVQEFVSGSNVQKDAAFDQAQNKLLQALAELSIDREILKRIVR